MTAPGALFLCPEFGGGHVGINRMVEHRAIRHQHSGRNVAGVVADLAQ